MEPDKSLPFTRIDVVRFPSGLDGNGIIEKNLQGPLQPFVHEGLDELETDE
ncbi:MAG: hypothetical protein J6C22_14420 [Bacteroides sp.]|nr:hypothetical protein [Bacteroides sp.]